MLLGVFTELASVGGIQQVGRHVGTVLEEFARARGEPCQLLSLNDSAGTQSFQVGARRYEFRGFAGRKAELATRVCWLAPKTRFAYFGHAHLAPLGLGLRVLNRHSQYWVAAHGIEVWTRLPHLHRFALDQASQITAVSAFTASTMSKVQGLDRERIIVLPPALDPVFSEEAQNTRLPGLPPEGRVLLTVGRLVSTEPGKGVDTVIRALRKVLELFPDLYYVVGGGGDAQPDLKALAVQSGVAERVIFVGRQNLPALRSYYNRADVFVMPSRQEGFGLVFLEAMAAGKPVVAARCGGTPEVVQDGVTGLLINYGDVDALVDGLTKLLKDAQLRIQMGEAGFRHLQENYTFERFRERLTRILDAAIA